MEFSVKNCSALLDKNLHIVTDDTTKDFLAYFDYNCNRIIDFVHPDEQSRFVDLILGEADGRSEVFRLLRATGEYRYNFVTARNTKAGYAARIQLFDIYDAIDFIRTSAHENKKINLILGLTNEYLFSYQKSTTQFTILYYNQGHEHTVCKLPFAEWKEKLRAAHYVTDDEIPQLELLSAELENAPQDFTVRLASSFRTDGAVIENLRFLGMRMDTDTDTFLVGRILSDMSLVHLQQTHSVLGSLQFDPLTQVYNKKSITTYIKRRIKAAEAETFACILLNLDHFKEVNEANGSVIGDKMLACVASTLEAVVGDDGVVGRSGGDEFVVLLNGIENPQILRGMLRALLQQVRLDIKEQFEGETVTCSLGASVYPANGSTYEELFSKADFCLRRAKAKGRSRYVFFRDDIHAKTYAYAQKAKEGAAVSAERANETLPLISAFMQQLALDKTQAVKNILRQMQGAFSLDSACIYAGEDMKLLYASGSVPSEQKEASYTFGGDFAERIDGDGTLRIEFADDIPDEGEFGKEMRRRNICASLHCAIGPVASPKGFIVFSKCNDFAVWKAHEVQCAQIVAAALNLLDLEQL